MQTKLDIRRTLDAQGIKVTTTKLIKQAETFGFGNQETYDDEQAYALINHFENAHARPQQKRTKPTDDKALANVMERSEGAMINAFAAQNTLIAQEMQQAAIAAHQLIDNASDQLVTLYREVKPRIYWEASRKIAELEAQKTNDFSIGNLFADAMVLPGFESSLPALPGSPDEFPEAYGHAH